MSKFLPGPTTGKSIFRLCQLGQSHFQFLILALAPPIVEVVFGTTSPKMTDVIMAMREPYMTDIAEGRKKFEFRKYRLSTAKRIWFYQTSPHQCIRYVCDVGPVRTRQPGDEPLPEGPGMDGNYEFNHHDKEWYGYDFAYEILDIHELKYPITLEELEQHHGLKSAPRGWMYTPASLLAAADLTQQNRVR